MGQEGEWGTRPPVGHTETRGSGKLPGKLGVAAPQLP
jgi:hypothetical protein